MKISVCTVTYNHEKYIAQAIEGVMAQRTRHSFEMVIGEDASTDRTREICIEFGKRYPDKVRLLLREKNLGAAQNFVQTLQECRGEYVALMEGDDYWTSPDKLQHQADFLDTHEDYAIVFGRADMVQDGESSPPRSIPAPEYRVPKLSMEDLLRCNCIPTCSVMFRNGLIPRFPDWYFDLPMGDWPLHVMNAVHGKIGYVDEPVAVYRLHPQSNYSSRDPLSNLRGQIPFYRSADEFLAFKYHALIEKQIAGIQQEIARLSEIIRPEQLKELGLSGTREESDLHRALSTGSVGASPENVKAVHRWLVKLQRANQARRVFKEPAFSRLLGKMWWSVCRHAERPNRVIAKRFVFSPFLRHVPLTWRERLYVFRDFWGRKA